MRRTLALAAAILAGGAEAARATDFVVNTTLDTPDAVLDGQCQDAETFCSLRAAIQELNAQSGSEPDTITLPAGTYTIDVTVGDGEDAAATGDLDLAGQLEIQGAGAGSTIVQAGGDGLPKDRVFEVLAGAEVTLRDLTIRGGRATTSTTFAGGGILNLGSLVLSGCRVEDNWANTGGGIYNAGSLVIDACTVSGNQAQDLGFTNAEGGGVRSSDALGVGAITLEVRNTTFAGNASFTVGAAISTSNADSATLENSTLSGNTGISTFRVQNVDAVSLTHVTLHDNQASGVSAFSFDGSHTLELVNTIVSSNTDCSFSDLLVVSSVGSLGTDGSCGFVLDGLDPALGPLQDNGGPTETHLPLAGSPAIGNASSPDCLPEDQRGELRPDGTGGPGDCDIGAVEVVPEPGVWTLGLAALGASVSLARRRSS